jgi:hypothetical protein
MPLYINLLALIGFCAATIAVGAKAFDRMGKI